MTVNTYYVTRVYSLFERKYFTSAVQCLRRSSSACSFYQVNLLQINVRWNLQSSTAATVFKDER